MIRWGTYTFVAREFHTSAALIREDLHIGNAMQFTNLFYMVTEEKSFPLIIELSRMYNK